MVFVRNIPQFIDGALSLGESFPKASLCGLVLIG